MANVKAKNAKAWAQINLDNEIVPHVISRAKGDVKDVVDAANARIENFRPERHRVGRVQIIEVDS